MTSFYAPDKKHHWILIANKELYNIPELFKFNGKFYITKNYAGQCWGYEVERVETNG